MKKFLLTLFCLLLSVPAFAASSSGVFPIQFTLPAATTVKFVVSEVTPGAQPVFTAHTGNFLDFDAAGVGPKYLSGPGIWVADHFWAIDVAPTDAAGTPAPGNYGSISFAYSGQVVPAGQDINEGLNNRATLTAVKVSGVTGSQTEAPLRKGALGASVVNLVNSDVAGGFLRVYIGSATGETGVNEVVGTKPFTNGDKPGVYTGTLTITATLI